MNDPLNLSALPPPNVVEVLDFEQILSELKADFLERHPAAAEVLELESEPLVKVFETAAYREMLVRARVNDAARAHLLAYAMDGDLDHAAAMFGVARLEGEKNDRLRLRIQLRVAALAAQGTREHYEYLALTASDKVRAVRASQPTQYGMPIPGEVTVLLWLSNQQDTEAVRTLVDTAINSDNPRMLGVNVTVTVARPKYINVTARISRLRSAPAYLLQSLESRVRAAFDGMRSMTSSVSRSYITTLLHVDGVHAVEFPDDAAPASVTAFADDEYPALGTVQLIDAGVVS